MITSPIRIEHVLSHASRGMEPTAVPIDLALHCRSRHPTIGIGEKAMTLPAAESHIPRAIR